MTTKQPLITDSHASDVEHMRSPRPLESFGIVFGWDLKRAFGGRRFLISLLLAGGIGALLGYFAVPHGPLVTDDTRYFELWKLLDEQSITFLLPLAALVFVTQSFSREVSQRTLVYHLVRPVTRTTLYLAKYAAGVIPGIVVAMVGLFTMALTTGVELPSSVFVAIPAVSTVGVLSLGALYYLLATLFKNGLIAALVYTFLIEQALAFGRGAIANLSASYHLRSLMRGLINDDFSERSRRVSDTLNPVVAPRSMEDAVETMLSSLGTRVYEPPATAIAILLVGAAAMLALGAWRIGARDFPLKD